MRHLLMGFLLLFIASPTNTQQPSNTTSSSTAAPRAASSPRCRRRRWASPSSSSARTNISAASPAAAWASPTRATKRSSAGWRASSIIASGSTTTSPQPGTGRSGASTATKARARRPSTASQRTMWIFEPHVAEQVFEDFVKEFEIPVHRDEWLDRDERREEDRRPHHLDHDAQRQDLTRARCSSTPPTKAICMAAAGVDYHVGREANSVYGEKWNGVQTGVLHHRHHFGVAEREDQPLRRSRRSEERRAAAHQHGAARRIRRGRQARAGLLLPHVPDRSSREPRPVRQARRLRSQAIRTAAAHLRRRLARDLRQVRSDPQSQDRHE